MAKQTNINSIIQKQVNNFHAGPKTESKSETGSFKLTASQKIALKQIAEQRGIGVSQLVSASIELYLDLLPHVDVLRDNMDIVAPMLERLR
jgi:hypothetical protein